MRADCRRLAQGCRTAAAALVWVTASASGQTSHLPLRSLTGPNGEFIHDAWHGSRAEFPDIGAAALAQDSLGFLLVATPRGIYRFDGRQFLGPWTFPFNGAETIALDQDGSLWAAGQDLVGLARRLRDGTERPILLPTGKAVGPVGGMALAPDGSLYFSCAQGIFVVRGGDPVLLAAQSLAGPMVVAPNGTLWVGALGLQELRDGSLVARPDLWNPSGGNLPTALMFDRSGNLWIGGNDELIIVPAPGRAGGGAVRRIPKTDLRLSGAISSLLEDDRGQVWIGTAGGGLGRYRDGQISRLTSGEGLSGDFVTALLQDRTGNIWIATKSGLDRLRPRGIRNLTARDGLGDTDVWSVAVDPGGGLLVGTEHGGISRVRNRLVTPLRDAQGLPLNQWTGALEFGTDGTLYLGSQRPEATWRLDPNGALIRWKSAGQRDTLGRAYSFLADPDGSLWVAGTSHHGTLFRHRGGTVTEYSDRAGKITEPIWNIVRDTARTLWVAAGALYRLSGDSLERVCSVAKPELLSAILPTVEGVWFGGGNGSALSLYRNGRCRTLRGSGVPATDVYTIERDHTGRIWVAATEGLIAYDESELLRRAADSLAPLTARAFDRLDGIQSAEFNSYGDSPSAITKEGTLLFASAGGLVVVDPGGLPHNTVPPRPLILSAFVNDSGYAHDRPISAPLGHRKVEFTFTAPSLSIPERLRLQYRLDGRDKDWTEAGDQRRVVYSGLSGGDYTFRVRAANEDGVWSLVEATIPLRLFAPFTSTWPFYGLLGAILLASGFGVGAVRSRVAARRQEQLEQLVERRTRELADARDRLEERVAARTAALAQESADRLKAERSLHDAQRMESVGRLAGGVAHDLNNMLTVVLGNADILRESLADTADAEEVAQIIGAGTRAARLTSQLLTFARRQVGQPKAVHLDELIRDLQVMLQRLAGEQVTLEIMSSSTLGSIWADRGQMEQVLVNLTMNARDAMPNGGTLTIETSDTELSPAEVSERPGVEPGAYVRLVVRDTGVGIEPHLLAHVFEPFYSTKEATKGTGLGLASCFGITKQWGGHIAVTSEIGRGATFELLFPRGVQDSAPEEVGSPTPTIALATGERILLVEDEPVVRQLARRILESSGYLVTEASDGEEAIARLSATDLEIDLVLSDVVMPRMNGKALADQIRKTHPSLPVLLMTGYSHDVLAENLLLDPAYRVVGKPFNRATLLNEVRQVIGTNSELARPQTTIPTAPYPS